MSGLNCSFLIMQLHSFIGILFKVENNVQRLAIPQIGCGIDRLEWPKVKQLLMDVFSDTDMEIVVYIFP